jgi:hypothetical protein
MLNGDAHLSEIEGELRDASDPLPRFQRLNAEEDTTWAFWLLISAGTSTGSRRCRSPGLTGRGGGPRVEGHARGPSVFFGGPTACAQA